MRAALAAHVQPSARAGAACMAAHSVAPMTAMADTRRNRRI
jgi:hypothetical protein